MKAAFFLLFACVPCLPAITASTTLQLVSEPGFNVLTVRLAPRVGIDFSDTDTTTLTGAVTGVFNVDPQAGTTSELTLTNGRVNGTPMSFSRSVFLVGGYSLNITQYSAALATISPPGIVTPSTGQFDAAQHAIVFDQGAVTGSTSGLLGSNSVNETLSPSNAIHGAGTGVGTVSLAPQGDSGIYRLYTATITLPLAFADALNANGLLVDVTGSGVMKAVGQLQVPRTAYLAWTAAQNQPGVSFTADADGDGIANGVLWALGLSPGVDPRPHLPRLDSSNPGGLLLTLPSGGTSGSILVECTSNLSTWQPADLGALPNPLPAGTTGTITIPPSASSCRFFRLSVPQP